MKLKLQNQPPVTLLTVTEGMSGAQVQVLSAGLSKLLASGQKKLVIDLTAVPVEDLRSQEIQGGLFAIKADIRARGGEIMMVCGISELADAPVTADAMTKMASSAPVIQDREGALKTELERLNRQKAELERLFPPTAMENLKKLRAENSELKIQVVGAESLLKRLLKNRPGENPQPENRYPSVRQTVAEILKNQGVLKE